MEYTKHSTSPPFNLPFAVNSNRFQSKNLRHLLMAGRWRAKQANAILYDIDEWYSRGELFWKSWYDDQYAIRRIIPNESLRFFIATVKTRRLAYYLPTLSLSLVYRVIPLANVRKITKRMREAGARGQPTVYESNLISDRINTVYRSGALFISATW